MNYILLIVSILISALSQVVFKWQSEVLNKTEFNSSFDKIIGYATSKGILLSILFSIVGGLLWYYALSIMKLSTAYPFTALSYVFIAFFGFILLKESINYYQLMGYVLVIGGILLITLKQ